MDKTENIAEIIEETIFQLAKALKNVNSNEISYMWQALGEKEIKKPKKFYGNPSEDPRLFLKSFQKACLANRWTTTERKLELVGNYLRGRAQDWWEDVHEVNGITVNPFTLFEIPKHGIPSKVRCFEQDFLEHFENKDSENAKIAKMINIRQRKYEDGAEYYSRAIKTIKRANITNSIDDALKQYFITQGLQKPYYEFVDNKDPESLEDLLKALIRADAKFTNYSNGHQHKIKSLKYKRNYYNDDSESSSNSDSDISVNKFSKNKKNIEISKRETFIDSSSDPSSDENRYTNNRYKNNAIKNKNKSNFNKIAQILKCLTEKKDKYKTPVPIYATQELQSQNMPYIPQKPQLNNGCYNCQQIGHFAFNCPFTCSTCLNAQHSGANCHLRTQNQARKFANQRNPNANLPRQNWRSNNYNHGGNQGIFNSNTTNIPHITEPNSNPIVNPHVQKNFQASQ